jgi:hypothetical protein
VKLLQAAFAAKVVRLAFVIDLAHRVCRRYGHPANRVENFGGSGSAVIV